MCTSTGTSPCVHIIKLSPAMPTASVLLPVQSTLTEEEEEDPPVMAFVDFYDYGEDEAYEISFAQYKLEYTEAGPAFACNTHLAVLWTSFWPWHTMRFTVSRGLQSAWGFSHT